jgi:hypothetical protein
VSVLVKVAGGAAAVAALNGIAGQTVEPILEVPDSGGMGLAAGQSTWLRVKADGLAENPWDQAHSLLTQGSAFAAAAGNNVQAVEPDIEQQWPYAGSHFEGAHALDAQDFCGLDKQNTEGGRAPGPRVAWNLGDDFSELAAARTQVGDKLKTITIAHLDTGFDPKHETKPANLLPGRNFVDANTPNDATDRVPAGESSLTRNRGHGTGTLSLLAGNAFNGGNDWQGFSGPVGGAPTAGIIPVRIADWVVRLSTSTMVQGFNHARERGAHVLSMSMGGLSSEALVDAVNLAYEAGMVMVTAGGNNYAGAPMPKSIVFPARHRRVLAACGAMANGRPYAGLSFGTMQGSYGPDSKMETALSAYTPNVPWAQIDCPRIVDMDGAGTSAATPQVAAAAALWLAQHWDRVKTYSKPWMRVEAVRRALFQSANRGTPGMSAAEIHEKLGQGIMRARRALAIAPAAETDLKLTERDKASWGWLDLLLNRDPALDAKFADPRALKMFHLKLTQMAQRIAAIEQEIPDPDQTPDNIPVEQRRRYLEAALDLGSPSQPLRLYLENLLQRRAVVLKPAATAVSSTAARAPIRRRPPNPPEPKRRLRTYALDPSLGQSLESLAVNETVLTVDWDDKLSWKPSTADNAMRPGPIGEYLEVIDVDPASDKIYPPVDLNQPELLAQDGWPPSEGNPQFHQQMVYAVGMTTIKHFERALGRRALWAPNPKDAAGNFVSSEKSYVQRLRIYPHAFRGRNAYYSPDKKALRFGYFPAQSRDSDSTAPGSMVFACLSSDIVAHEMTHALLDGLHRRFEEASNLDVPAFHEGFADIVALFQHFTVTELVRFEIGRKRGDLSAAQLLGGLAKQFGEGSSRGGPLRNYLDPEMRSLKYSETLEPHTRGSILVYAVYEAFLLVVTHRTQDLLRIATGGTGVLGSGALHPDLVQRLTEEVCEAAADILQMCIRALDYCPAVDITFGEYLRAIITADRDLFPQDRYGRRVAFMEAFRHRGILPRDVRTISEESLTWSPLNIDDFSGASPDKQWGKWLQSVAKSIQLDWDLETDRKQSFLRNAANCAKVRNALEELFTKNPDFYAQFGLMDGLPEYSEDWKPKEDTHRRSTFQVSSVRPARRLKPNGSFQTDIVVVLSQRRPEQIDQDDPTKGMFWFRGGATVILEPITGAKNKTIAVRYVIVKNMTSETRLQRQRQMLARTGLGLQALYFRDRAMREPFAMMHAEQGELQND